MRVGLVSNRDDRTIVEIFSSAKQAAEEFGVATSTMERAIRHGRMVQRKYKFVYIEEKEK